MTIIDWTGTRPLDAQRAEAEPLGLDFQEQLNREAVFSLRGHELKDPQTSRGYVSSIDVLDPISMAGNALPEGVQLFEVKVVDPYVDADPVAYSMVREHVEGLEGMVRARGFNPLEERQKDHPYMKDGEIAGEAGQGNPFTKAWLAGGNLSGLKAWHSNVPTAEALGYLTDPCVNCTIQDKEGEEFVSSPETAAHLRFVDDAVAIRDRAVAMQEIAKGILNAKTEGSKIRWLSLASGTGEPSIAASKEAADTNGLEVELVVADLNPNSLNYVKEIAQKYNFGSQITTVYGDILKENFPERLAKKTGSSQKYDVVENMGFEEYLPQEGDELGAYKEMGLMQASDFTRMAYEQVAPGGSLISGNMVLDRPQIDFVFGIVDWPIINARSEESILRIYEKAGIPMDQIKLYRVKDEITGAHVYDIVEVTKPALTRIEKAAITASVAVQDFVEEV